MSVFVVRCVIVMNVYMSCMILLCQYILLLLYHLGAAAPDVSDEESSADTEQHVIAQEITGDAYFDALNIWVGFKIIIIIYTVSTCIMSYKNYDHIVLMFTAVCLCVCVWMCVCVCVCV